MRMYALPPSVAYRCGDCSFGSLVLIRPLKTREALGDPGGRDLWAVPVRVEAVGPLPLSQARSKTRNRNELRPTTTAWFLPLTRVNYSPSGTSYPSIILVSNAVCDMYVVVSVNGSFRLRSWKHSAVRGFLLTSDEEYMKHTNNEKLAGISSRKESV